ncbi:uncharacterized protein LOC107630716 isoform X2 [Arachis ipaensis]|uniref:uncharacterized protein LOC107630716 isoform X2 n=1 Tax=Arachis ipaensis TaxID=130454 RepID=UPI000A2B5C3A|nr:uncharacterized protein LOC107630716 isoform X2 [Arachis ipaensis]
MKLPKRRKDCCFLVLLLLLMSSTLQFDKVDRGGEDALLVSNYNGGVLAIADGVSGWAEEDVDPSLFPHELMAVQRIAIGSPREVAQPDAIRAAFAEFFSTLIFVFAAEGSDMSYNNLTQALLFLSHFMGDIHQSFFTFYALVVERFGQRIGLFCLFALIFPAFLCVVYERWLQKLYCMIFQLTLPLAIPVIAFMHSSKHTHSRYWFLAIDEEQSPKNLKLLSYFAHANWQLDSNPTEVDVIQKKLLLRNLMGIRMLWTLRFVQEGMWWRN